MGETEKGEKTGEKAATVVFRYKWMTQRTKLTREVEVKQPINREKAQHE